MKCDFLRFAGPDARRFVGVNRGTWSRWLAGKSRVPCAVYNLLRVLVAGEILHEGWEGWTLRNGELHDPSGQRHTPATILAWHWTRQELMAARRDENQSAGVGENVVRFPGRRSASNITTELYRRLGDID